MPNSKKVLLIGWDAADWKVINPLMDQGRMPNMLRMVENGTIGNMRTLFPPLSPMLWTSIATGKRPYKHGIYGFTEPNANGSGIQPITNVSRKCKAFWNILNQHNQNSIVVGWWPSHPAEPINGVMVSDYFGKAPKKPGDPWPLNERAVYPHDRLKELAEYRVHPMELTAEDILPFIPHGADIDQTNDSRVSNILKVTAECSTIHAAATHLLENDDWDFAAIYYDAIDHYSHAFMKYHPPQQSGVSDEDFRHYSNVVTMGYIFHDMMLGKLLDLADDDTTVILISDHGFHPDHLRPKHIPSEPAGPAFEHRDYGIFAAMGPNIKKDHIVHGANLLDITPTLLNIYNLPVGEDMDGMILSEIFEEPNENEFIESWENIDGDDGQHPPDFKIAPQESKEALEQLIALGYIERPADDSGVAIAYTQRELDYNLARSLIDAEMYGDALPIFQKLYNDFPLEFRFGVQLANCLRATNRTKDLMNLIDDMNARWRKASSIAKAKIKEVAVIARERRDHWRKLKELDEKNDDPTVPKLARVMPNGKPILFEENEAKTIRALRSISRGNPQTLDFLAATVASANGDHKSALKFLEKASKTRSRSPGFQFHLGNAYMEKGQAEDAQQAYLKGLELDELHPECVMGLSRCKLAMGETREAIDFSKQAIGLKYHFPVAHYFLGLATRAAGDFPGAIACLETALEQNPNFVEAHDELIQIYQSDHKNEKLASYHNDQIKKLTAAEAEYDENDAQIDFTPLPDEEFEKHLPKIMFESDNKEFIPCLSQPRAKDVDVDNRPEVVIVSGLPRSGTSMMMQMLVAGGLTAHTDNIRVPDESNPKGYYEVELVKQLRSKNDWLAECEGKVVKVVAPLVPFLPQNVKYKVIFMRRPIDKVLASQDQMLQRLGEKGAAIDNEQLAGVFGQQAQHAVTLLKLHENDVLRVAYSDVVDDPAKAAAIVNEFMGGELDENAMSKAVNPSLQRQK